MSQHNRNPEGRAGGSCAGAANLEIAFFAQVAQHLYLAAVVSANRLESGQGFFAAHYIGRQHVGIIAVVGLFLKGQRLGIGHIAYT